jgi:hypothetical protein
LSKLGLVGVDGFNLEHLKGEKSRLKRLTPSRKKEPFWGEKAEKINRI